MAEEERENNFVDVYELFEVNNDFHDSVISLPSIFAKLITES